MAGLIAAIGEIKRARPSLHLSLPSNRVDTGPVALNAAANARQSSITLAPEAATQRMRDIICKTITDEMIERAIEAAFAHIVLDAQKNVLSYEEARRRLAQLQEDVKSRAATNDSTPIGMTSPKVIRPRPIAPTAAVAWAATSKSGGTVP